MEHYTEDIIWETSFLETSVDILITFSKYLMMYLLELQVFFTFFDDNRGIFI